MIRRDRLHREADIGYTLVEMLVTIVVFTLILGSITGVIVTAMRHQSALRDRDATLASIRNSIENVDRDIRSANPLCYGTSTEITMLETNAATGFAIADYQLINNGTQLRYTEYSASTSSSPNLLVPPTTAASITCSYTLVSGTTPTTQIYYGNSQIVQRVVIRDLVNTGSSPVFLQATAPSATTVGYDSCPGTGSTGAGTPLSATTAAAAGAVSAITVNVSDKPSTLSQPVSASDCGTYLPNSVNSL